MSFRARLMLGLLFGSLFGLVEHVNMVLSTAPVPSRFLIAQYGFHLGVGLMLGLLTYPISFVHSGAAISFTVFGIPLLYSLVFLNDLALSDFPRAFRIAGSLLLLLCLGAITLTIGLYIGRQERKNISRGMSRPLGAAVIFSTLLVLTVTRVLWPRGDAASTAAASLYGGLILFIWLLTLAVPAQWWARLLRPELRSAALGIVAVTVLITIGSIWGPPRHYIDLASTSGGDDLESKSVPAPESPPDMIIISMDTARRDRFSLYGHGVPTTPNLERIAEESLVFEDALSTAPWTPPSHASLFTGLFPFEHGVVHDPSSPMICRPLSETATTLAEVLRSGGYSTAAFVANTGFLNHRLGFSQGFDNYHDSMTFTLAQLPVRIGAALPPPGNELILRWMGVNSVPLASEICRRAISWIDGRRDDRPFFLFLNLMEAHGVNYLPFPGGLRLAETSLTGHGRLDRMKEAAIRGEEELSPTCRQALLEWYDREILFMDQAIGRFMDRLRERGLYRESLIVIWSDHGELFGEHASFGHETELYEELLRVPLLIKLPHAPSIGSESNSGEVSAYIQQTDIFHFLLEQVGMSSSLPSERGGRISRLLDARSEEDGSAETVAGPPVLAELRRSGGPARSYPERYDRDLEAVYFRSAEGEDWKLIHSSRGEIEVYCLSTDPSESTNLAEERSDMVQELLPLARQWKERSAARLELMDEEGGARALEGHLRSLGYVR